MKRLVIFLSLMMLCSGVFAQSVSSGFVSESSAVKFEETKGSIIKKERFTTKNFSDLIYSVSISSAMITNLRTGEKVPYVIVGTIVDKVSYQSVIDFDELPACIEALDYIINSEVSNKPSNSVDVFFKTRDALEIGAIYNDIAIAGKKWQTAITHRKYVSNPTAIVSVKNLQEIMDELESAKALLEEKMQ